MAKKSSSRFFVIKDEPQISLTTLGSDTVKLATAPTLSQDVRTQSIDVSATLRGLTENEGPIEFGIADSALTVTEIAEALDANPAHESDVPAIEQARRKVRVIGIFAGEFSNEVFNDGKYKRTKLNWFTPAQISFPNLWVRNRSGAALTTGATLEFGAKYYNNWK